MELQFTWKITGISKCGHAERKVCREAREWNECLEACQTEARLHCDPDIFSDYNELQVHLISRPHPNFVNQSIKQLKRDHTLKHLLLSCYARESRRVIFEKLVKELCYGCSVNHPSQRQHDVCLMMEENEQMDLCMDQSLERVSKESVMHRWLYEAKDVIHPPVNGLDIIKYSYEDISKDKETIKLLIQALSIS